jgi:hypothetical protein
MGDIRLEEEPDGSYTLRYHAQKTEKPAYVPNLGADVFEAACKIRETPVLSNAVYNRCLKRLAKKTGLSRRGAGGNETPDSVLSDVLSSHALKRSFVHHMLRAGIPVRDVATMTGNSIRTIETYIPPSEQSVDDALKVAGLSPKSASRVDVRRSSAKIVHLYGS